jgi:hypothetical protein
MPWKRSDAGPCECDWLARAAAEPDVPIEFDAAFGEYSLVYDPSPPRSQGRMLLYFCPFCGGAAPTSQRQEFFTRITAAELARLRELTAGLHMLEDVLRHLGPPDQDLPLGDAEVRPAAEGRPPVAEQFHTVVYENLSETVVVRVNERADGSVRFSFTGKYIGPPGGGPDRA